MNSLSFIEWDNLTASFFGIKISPCFAESYPVIARKKILIFGLKNLLLSSKNLLFPSPTQA